MSTTEGDMTESVPIPLSRRTKRVRQLCQAISVLCMLCILAIRPGATLAQSSSDSIWTELGSVDDATIKAGPRKYHRVMASAELLRGLLRGAPGESDKRKSDVIITVPMPDGTFER